MQISNIAIRLAALALTGAIAIGTGNAAAQQKILKMDVGGAGSTTHVLGTVVAKMLRRATGVSVQINDGQTLTRSSMKLGRAQIDLMPLPPAIYDFMTKGSRMYKKRLHKEAIAASKNIRGIFGYLANLFDPVTFERTGIKTWADIKGKRVFTGPPSGAAAVTSESMIRALTGYEANKDYKAIRLPWGGGLQAMMDGKLDVFMRPDGLGSAMIEQLGLTRKFRLLNAADSSNKAAWGKWTKGLGRSPGIIPAGTYKGQVNNNINIAVGAVTFQIGVNKQAISEDMAYRMTKLTWDKLGEIHQTAASLRSIKKSSPFTGVNMPLHMGAVRYYRENGIKIPAKLLPPEAK